MPRTTTKTTAKKPVKKTATAATKATPKKTVRSASAHHDEMHSFRPYRHQGPFLTLQITRQTLYWGIIAILVVGLAAWVLHLQMQIIEIYDSIERNELLNS